MTPAKIALSFAPIGSTQQVRGTVSVVKTPHNVSHNEWFDDVSIYTEGDEANGVLVTETTMPQIDSFPTMQRLLNSVQKSIQKLTTKTMCTMSTNTTPSLSRCIFTESESITPVELSAPMDSADRSSVVQKVSTARASWFIILAIFATFVSCCFALGFCSSIIPKALMVAQSKEYSIPTVNEDINPLRGSTVVPVSTKRRFEIPKEALNLQDKVLITI
jgi:hypothetical protein